MKIRTQNYNDVAVVELQGELDSDSSELFQNTIAGIIATHKAGSSRRCAEPRQDRDRRDLFFNHGLHRLTPGYVEELRQGRQIFCSKLGIFCSLFRRRFNSRHTPCV